MSTTDDAPVAPAAPATAAVSGVADPAPLGLAAFALTTFLLSAINAGWAKNTTGASWFGYAIAYGGLVQLLAGMWEFRNRNVFGAVAFSSYGAFWIGLGIWFHFVPATVKVTALVTLNRDLGWILLAWAIFNFYMLLHSTQVNAAVFAVFLTLQITEVLLFVGNFVTKNPSLPPFNITPLNGWIQAGGYVGVITALVAWYTSSAGVINGLKGRPVFPVGKPLFSMGRAR